MTNYGYILDGWENRDLWALVNSTWVYSAEVGWQLRNEIPNGYGQREFDDIYNVDWLFDISYLLEILPSSNRIVDKEFYLDGDAKPIIFRHSYPAGSSNYPRTYSIIYDDIVRDTRTFTYDPGSHSTKVYRVGTTYYFTSYNLSFDYGTKKKPIKIRLTNANTPFALRWWNLSWYYTEPISLEEDDYAFVA